MQLFFYFIFGVVFWTFMEYMLHRFLGHEWVFKNKFRKEHQKHHHVVGYFASFQDKAITSVVFGSITFLIMFFVKGFNISLSFTSGFILMYLAYEQVHKSLHVKAPKTKYDSVMRKHHFYHHFCDGMVNHGVTSIFWDKVFGTYVPTKNTLVTINKKFKMDWLCEREEVLPHYRVDYCLVEKTKFT